LQFNEAAYAFDLEGFSHMQELYRLFPEGFEICRGKCFDLSGMLGNITDEFRGFPDRAVILKGNTLYDLRLFFIEGGCITLKPKTTDPGYIKFFGGIEILSQQGGDLHNYGF
jgi:hypothetical protein